jgi:hypothetical protein
MKESSSPVRLVVVLVLVLACLVGGALACRRGDDATPAPAPVVHDSAVPVDPEAE